MELITVKLHELTPYPNNPRINDGAVDAVAESIRQCGYIAPIIVDENLEILAGHTRYKALKKLGKKECEILVKSGLSEEQKRKYRLLDNKTNELADWDFDALEIEIEDLDFGDLELDWNVGDDEDYPEDIEASANSKDNVIVSLNVPSYSAWEQIENEIKRIAETVNATVAVKME